MGWGELVQGSWPPSTQGPCMQREEQDPASAPLLALTSYFVGPKTMMQDNTAPTKPLPLQPCTPPSPSFPNQPLIKLSEANAWF